MEYYVATGSTGLFANCLSSEMFQLTDEERIQITKTVVDQVKGRQKVLSTGTFGYDQERNIDFIKRIHGTGTYAVIMNSNQLAMQSESDEVLKKNMDQILASTGDIPLGVYECPVPYKRLVSPQLLGWLGQTGRFAFLKDTCCNLDQIKLKLQAVEGTRLQIYNANISTGMSSIQFGAKGLASTASNFYPELIQYLAQNPNLENKESNKINTFITLMDSLIHEYYPMSAKYFMQLRGMKISTLTRTPVGHFTHQDFVKFDKLFEAFGILSEELEIEVYRF